MVNATFLPLAPGSRKQDNRPIVLSRVCLSLLVLGCWFLAPAACGGETSAPGGGSGGTSGGSGGTSGGSGGTSGSSGGTSGSSGGTSGSSGGTGGSSGGTGGSSGGTSGSSGMGGTSGDGGNVCLLPAEVGPCRGLIARFWFNSATGRCEPFTYGGCGGNANNFESPAACVEACAPGTSNACSKTACDNGAQCVFVDARPAQCLQPCADPGACPPNMVCRCGGSCPGCENCTMVCVPL